MENKTAKQLEKELLYTAKPAVDEESGVFAKAERFCEGYKAFLDAGKTEREAAALSVKMLEEAGYKPFEAGRRYQAGEKVYYNNRGKCVLAATVGRAPLEAGIHMNMAHIDSPRLDLKQLPLYEEGGLALFKTHYYGGLRKYQWTAVPLALHGVLYKAGGERVNFCVGEKESDPVFCVTDLLPHLSADQNNRTLKGGIKGEELNIVVGSLPIEDEDAKQRVKLFTMRLLNEQYGLVEKDFIRAEIEAVPAYKAKDVGFDRSLIGAYGQDDLVEAYPALVAEIEVQNPWFTTLCALTDKEEIGSDGVTGLQSDYVFHFIQQLCQGQNADYVLTLMASKCLSSDVTNAFDPTFPDVSDKRNSAYAGKGVCLTKYTGGGGKSSTNDASAELVAYFADLLDEAGVAWQTGELGKVDQGGGGTVAKFVARRNVDTIDLGVPVLSMHAPFELVAKVDVYMAYKAFAAFARAER